MEGRNQVKNDFTICQNTDAVSVNDERSIFSIKYNYSTTISYFTLCRCTMTVHCRRNLLNKARGKRHTCSHSFTLGFARIHHVDCCCKFLITVMGTFTQ